MNKTAIKNFAIWARNKLIADISYQAGLMGITADGIHAALPQSTGQTEFYDIGTAEPYAITGGAIRQRRHLVELIQRKENDTDYKTAYDSTELSWEFKKHPLIPERREVPITIEKMFLTWSEICKNRFEAIENNEQELNDIFINTYNLQNEISPNIEDGNITILTVPADLVGSFNLIFYNSAEDAVYKALGVE